MLAIWSLVPLPLWNSACTSGSSQFTYCWNQTLLMGSMCMMDSYLEHSSLLPLCLNLHLLFAQTQDQRDEKNESLLRSLLGITQSCICVSLDISSRIYQGFSKSCILFFYIFLASRLHALAVSPTQAVMLNSYQWLLCVFSCSVMSDSLWHHELQPTRLLCPQEFSRQEYWSGLPCLPPRDLSNPGIEPRSPTLQADSLLSEPLGKLSDYFLTNILEIPWFALTKLWGRSNKEKFHELGLSREQPDTSSSGNSLSMRLYRELGTHSARVYSCQAVGFLSHLGHKAFGFQSYYAAWPRELEIR